MNILEPKVVSLDTRPTDELDFLIRKRVRVLAWDSVGCLGGQQKDLYGRQGRGKRNH